MRRTSGQNERTVEVTLEPIEFIDDVLEVLRDTGTVRSGLGVRPAGWLSGARPEWSPYGDTLGSIELVPTEMSVLVLRRRVATLVGTTVTTDA